MIFKGKHILLKLTLILVTVAGLFYLVPKLYSYAEARRLASNADRLVSEEKYADAITFYKKSQGVWSSPRVNKKLQDTKILLQSNQFYTQGLEHIDNEEWDNATIVLLKVDKSYRMYDNAQSLIEYARTKSENGNVKGIQDTTVPISNEVVDSTQFIPTAILIPPDTPTPMPISNPTQDIELQRQANYMNCVSELEKVRSTYMDKCYQDYASRNSEFPLGQNYYYNQCASTVISLYNKGRTDCANLFGN